MSGIAGVIHLDGSPVALTGLEAMLAEMARRGPDRRQSLCQGAAGFGHALLATTPESRIEAQPWRHTESGCVVVADSRLDNRADLARQLDLLGRPIDQIGDGELLHAAWQRWGDGCADRLRGDFAFAIWNPRRLELFVARDPMGVRPFAFHFQPGRRFVFGSTAEVVRAQGDVPTALDPYRIADALLGETEGIDATCTFYTAIQRLPPAHTLCLRAGQLNLQRYWRPVGDRPASLPRSEGEWIEAQRTQLDQAVRRRLRGDRPVGSMLSGGLDSSSVVALAAAARNSSGHPPFPVFSAVDSTDASCAETRSVRAVVAHVRCAPTLVDLPDFEQSTGFAKTWWNEADEPFDGGISLVAAVYAAASAQGVTSLMDGVPADNLFVTGRYPRHLFDQGRWREAWHAAVAQWRLPGIRFPRGHALRVMAGCLAPAHIHALREQLAERRQYRELLADSFIQPAAASRADLRLRFRRYRKTIGISHQWHPTDEALSSMSAPYITAGLERYNRVASLFGIEPRPPYADRDLIEFQAWMPIGLRTRAGHAKWVLRQAMAADLPADVVFRQDKSHIGWLFNRAVLAQSQPRSGAALLASDHYWLAEARLAAARRAPTGQASEGLLASIRWLCWKGAAFGASASVSRG